MSASESDAEEKWTIRGYLGRYAVTPSGLVWSHLSGRHLKPVMHVQGYARVRLYDHSGSYRWFLVHRLVAEAMVDGDKSLQVNHINGDKSDNRAENLEWISASENVKHSYSALGNIHSMVGRKGAKHPGSKPVAMIASDGTSIIFPSTMDAQRATGIGNSGISSAALGKSKQMNGYRWQYV